jgi:murein tripeptide amidase MpaA
MKTNSVFSTLVLLIIAISLSATSPVVAGSIEMGAQPDPNPVLMRIYFDNQVQLNQLATRYDVWEVHHELGYLIAYIPSTEIQELDSAGFRVEIDQNLTSQLGQPRMLLPDQESGIPGYPCYRTVEETYASLSQLAIDQPELAAWIDIGDSWEKSIPGGKTGYDLHALVLTNKNTPGTKPKFYLMSAIHAREYATAELATRFAEYLVANYDIDPDITWLLDYYEIHIIPIANPDGRKIAENEIYWRKNTDNDDGCPFPSLWGTDLNRNSSFKWGGVGASSNSCDETYRGSSAASEPETQAIQKYAATLFADQRGPADSDPAPTNAEGVFITLHSYGELVLYPWGWTSGPSPNDAAFETLGRKFGYFTGYQVCRSGGVGCLYQTSGSNDDWVYGELGAASFTFELGTYFFQSCSYFENSILDKNINALLYAFKAARRPYQNPVGPDSIDLSLSAEIVAPGASLTLSAIADDTRYDSAGWGEESVQAIEAARYSLDKPTWFAGTQTHPFKPVDGSFDNPVEIISANIDTTSLSPGRHTIFVESQDADSNWGVPSAIFLWITAEEFQPAFFPSNLSGGGSQDSSVLYFVQLINKGTQDDIYDLEITGNNWEVSIPLDPVGPLAPNGLFSLYLSVTIPESAQIGDQDNATLTGISRGDPTKFSTLQFKTTALSPTNYLPTILK